MIIAQEHKDKIKGAAKSLFGIRDKEPVKDTKYNSKEFVPVKNWIPIKDIKDGIVSLKDGRYIKVIEVLPINFKLKTFKEKKMILLNYKAFLKACNFDMQIIMQSRKANVEPHFKMMQYYHDREENVNVRRMNRGYTNLVYDIAIKKKSISRRFFLVIEYKAPAGVNPKTVKFSDIYEDLNEKRDKVRDYLKKCGNKIIEHKTGKEDKELLMIYYSFLNPGLSNVQKLNPDPTDYVNMLGIKDSEEYEGALKTPTTVKFGEIVDSGRTDVIDVIAPGMINPKNPDYIQIDDTYISHLMIVNYALNQPASWLDDLLSINENVNISFHYELLDKDKVIRDITQTIGVTSNTLRNTGEAQADSDELEQKYGDAKYIRKQMSIAKDDLYYLYTYISIYAESLQELQYTLSRIESILNGLYLQSRRTNFRQEQTLKAVLPLAMNNADEIKKAARRNVLTKGLSSTYPYRSAELCDNDGIFVGRNDHNKSLVMIDIFNTALYKNANMNILGTSGAGKTFLLQLIAERLRLQGIQVMIVAPLKGHEFRKLCKAVGGEFIKIAPESPDCINILEIRKASYEEVFDEDDLTVKDKRQSSLLAAKIQKLQIFFALLFKNLSDEEAQDLDEALIETYKRKGITFDNESLYSNKVGNKVSLEREFKEMPIPGDLYDVLMENEKTQNLAKKMKRLVHGSLKSFNAPTNVNLNNKYIVADISEISSELLPLAMFTVIDLFWDKIKEDRSVKKAIFLDELWKMMAAAGSGLAAEFVFELFKIIRGYGGSAIAATQNVADFFSLADGKYGKGIINNSKIKFVLQLEKNDVESLKDVLNLSEEEEAHILSFSQGHGLFYAGDSHVEIEVIASDEEEEKITTDRKRLAEIKERYRLKGLSVDVNEDDVATDSYEPN